MKKFIFLLAILVLALMTVPAMADTYTLNYATSTNPNFNTSNNDEEYGYGIVTVTWTNSTHATVKITLLSTGSGAQTPNDFLYIRNSSAAFLNVAGTATWTVPTGWAATGTQPPDLGLGSFDVSLYRTGLSAVGSVTFTLTATNGTTWANAASVLEPNAKGFFTASYVEENYPTYSFPKGYVALKGDPPPVPIPPSALLLGSGLLGLAGIGWRRRTG